MGEIGSDECRDWFDIEEEEAVRVRKRGAARVGGSGWHGVSEGRVAAQGKAADGQAATHAAIKFNVQQRCEMPVSWAVAGGRWQVAGGRPQRVMRAATGSGLRLGLRLGLRWRLRWRLRRRRMCLVQLARAGPRSGRPVVGGMENGRGRGREFESVESRFDTMIRRGCWWKDTCSRLEACRVQRAACSVQRSAQQPAASSTQRWSDGVMQVCFE